MLYKPKYCCHCGEQIERIEWFPWTSGRFCETCETAHKIYDWLPRGLAAVGVLFSIFGLGAYLKSGEVKPSVAIKENRAEATKSAESPTNQKTVAQTAANVQTLLPPANGQTKPLLPASKLDPVPTAEVPKETVYFCGAETKKGTPCSRKVKGGGRCWQHAGQPAMLPPEKLVASR